MSTFFEIPIANTFLRSQSILLDPKTFVEIQKQPWHLKPLDLEIAQLAHHLRPIFGLVFYNIINGNERIQ